MVTLGIDAHKRNHTVVAVDEVGRKLGERTLGTTTADHLELVVWAQRFGPQRQWAVEDCRRMSRRLERDLLVAGERILRVPPKQALLKSVRQFIESVNARLKGQLDLELHGGRSWRGIAVRVAQRILAMAAAIEHNHKTSQPITRSLIAYDH